MAKCLLALIPACAVSSLSAELIVDGSFDVGFAGSTSKIAGDALNIGGDGLLIDDGWINGTSNAWTISSGVVSRGSSNHQKYSPRGFGQIVSNSAGYASGQDVVFSFDYNLTPGNAGFRYVLYGVTGDSSGQTGWLLHNGDSVAIGGGSVGVNGGPEPNGNYLFTELDGGPSQTGVLSGAGSYSATVTLGDDYDFFVVAFATDNDNNAASSLDNVSLVLDASGTVYYSDPVNGSMSNPGTSSQPWADLDAIFDAGKTFAAGDVIKLRDGHHGSPGIEGYNTGMVTIEADTGHSPHATKVNFSNGSYWTLSGLTVSPEISAGNPYPGGTLIYMNASASNIVVADCTVYSAADISSWTATDWTSKSAHGIFVRSPNSVIANNEVFNIDNGIVLQVQAEYTEANDNHIYNFAGDAMRALGNYQKVQYNTINDNYAVDGNHDDSLQFYTTGGATLVGVEVRGNLVINFTDNTRPHLGALQGIVGFDGMFEDFIIENNIVITDQWHGITLMGATDCLIINNTVADHPIQQFNKTPAIKVFNHKNGTQSTGNIVRNNVGPNIKDVSGGNTFDHNVKTSNYAAHYVDHANYDMRLISTSTLIDAGSSALAPAVDWEDDLRDSSPDIGADEY